MDVSIPGAMCIDVLGYWVFIFMSHQNKKSAKIPKPHQRENPKQKDCYYLD